MTPTKKSSIINTPAMEIKLAAHAKVNLYLGVEQQIVDGKHQMQSVFVTIGLHDTLSFAFSGTRQHEDGALFVSIDTKLGTSIKMPPIKREKNIVYKAIRAFEKEFIDLLVHCYGEKSASELRIVLQKNIPSQAGLGGGSSDAAATLRALAVYYELDIRNDEFVSARLCDVASNVGADVAFFLNGGCALMGGAGDVLLQRLPVPAVPCFMVVVKPRHGVSTKAAYAAFDADPQPAESVALLLDALSGNDFMQTLRKNKNMLANNLTSVAAKIVPSIRTLLTELQDCDGVVAALLSGSGSAIFGICENAAVAKQLARKFRNKGFWAQATQITNC